MEKKPNRKQTFFLIGQTRNLCAREREREKET